MQNDITALMKAVEVRSQRNFEIIKLLVNHRDRNLDIPNQVRFAIIQCSVLIINLLQLAQYDGVDVGLGTTRR